MATAINLELRTVKIAPNTHGLSCRIGPLSASTPLFPHTTQKLVILRLNFVIHKCWKGQGVFPWLNVCIEALQLN